MNTRPNPLLHPVTKPPDLPERRVRLLEAFELLAAEAARRREMVKQAKPAPGISVEMPPSPTTEPKP